MQHEVNTIMRLLITAISPLFLDHQKGFDNICIYWIGMVISFSNPQPLKHPSAEQL